jgi:ubiquinone/menaquinone biosynthesis C-methylase UbiE
MTVPPLDETIAAFDIRSATYDDSDLHRVVAQRAAAAADPQEGQTLLDLAGGTGLTARAALTSLGAAGRALVLDASPGMLRQARRSDPRLHTLRADAHHVPLRDRSVDRVTCVTALHLFHDPSRALREAARTCRPDGRVVFTTWAADGWSARRALRQAAAEEGRQLADPYEQRAHPTPRGPWRRPQVSSRARSPLSVTPSR